MTEDITDEDIMSVQSAVQKFTNKRVSFAFNKDVDIETSSRDFDVINDNNVTKYVIRINEYDEKVVVSYIRASQIIDQMSGLLQVRETT